MNGRPLAPATVRRIHGILRRALAQGVKWGWIGVNPAAAASPQKIPPSTIAPPDPDQLGRLLARARNESPELACYVLVAAATGARRSEVVALRWSDIDLANATIDISRGIVIGQNGMVEQDTKTHASRRVSLDAQTTGALSEHREQMLGRAAACGVGLAEGASCSATPRYHGSRPRCRGRSSGSATPKGSPTYGPGCS